MKVLKVLALGALLITSSVAKKEALIIGVSDYRNRDLKGIDRDIYNMETLLKDFDFHITKLTDSESLDIIAKLKEYKYLNENDTFGIYIVVMDTIFQTEMVIEVDGKDET